MKIQIYTELVKPLIYAILILATGCKAPDQSADIILINGNIITVDNQFSIQEAIAVQYGKIQVVGDNNKISKLAGKRTRIIDLKGKTVIPGIYEGHVHPVGASQSEFHDSLPDLRSINETLHWVHQQTLTRKKDDWIIHPKFFATRMTEMRQASKHELDSVSPDHPVFLNGSYGGMINSKAMELSGIGLDTEHPGFLRDSISGELTGFIQRSAFSLLSIPEIGMPDESQKLKLLEEMLRSYNKVGITSICVGGGNASDMELFRRLRENQALTVRVFYNLYFPFDPQAPLDKMRSVLSELQYATGDGDEWLKVGALKARVDGGVLTGTAYLREPWGENAHDIYGITDLNYRGVLNLGKEDLQRLITVAMEFGWKFTAHVTGGGGVDTLLAALEAVNAKDPIGNKRFSIIHGNFYTGEAISKMAKMGVYADMQPAWFYKDADLLFKVLGEKTIRTFHPYKSLTNAGVMVNGGSDHMVKFDPYTSVNPYQPFVAMWSVVTRKTQNETVYVPDEAITRQEALKMFTINNAYASFEEDIKGSLEPGKLADLVVISEDMLSCEEDNIKNIKALLTMVNGEVVYESAAVSAP